MLIMHKGRCSLVAIERASFAFAFPKGFSCPRLRRDCGGALFHLRQPRINVTVKRTAAMIKLLFWYLLERLVNIPAQCLIGIHSKLILKVTRALRKSKQADRERSRGNNSN